MEEPNIEANIVPAIGTLLMKLESESKIRLAIYLSSFRCEILEVFVRQTQQFITVRVLIESSMTDGLHQEDGSLVYSAANDPFLQQASELLCLLFEACMIAPPPWSVQDEVPTTCEETPSAAEVALCQTQFQLDMLNRILEEAHTKRLSLNRLARKEFINESLTPGTCDAADEVIRWKGHR